MPPAVLKRNKTNFSFNAFSSRSNAVVQPSDECPACRRLSAGGGRWHTTRPKAADGGHAGAPVVRPEIPFERCCDACARWHLLPGFTVRGAPKDDESVAAGAKEDAALVIHQEDEGNQQIHRGLSKVIAEIDEATAAVQRAADKSKEESLKPQHALHNPLDNWDHISASDVRDCHKCLTTHSSLWHLHLDLPTCHSCFVDLHRDACPFCGKRVPVKPAGMKFCVGCSRSFHRSCEERVRGRTDPAGLCIVCEMQMLLRQNESASTPREILLKKMPTILNFHIFKYQEIFGSIPPGRRNPSGYPHVQSAAGEKLNECGGVQLVPEAQKPADGTHIFRESLSLPTPASRGGINTPLSELSRATTYAPPQSSGAFSASSAKTHSSPSGPSWDEQHWPMNAAKVQTRQLETWSSGSEDTAGESGSRLTLFERRQRSGHTHIGIETSSSGADRVASKPKSSLQELLDYNKALNRSRQFEPQDKMPAPTLETPRRTIVSVMKSGLNDPNASPRKIFSWEKRLRTASDNLKQTLEDPAPHGVPHPVQKFLSPRANAAYVQQSPRLRTHFLGISPRPHDQNCKAKIDCWREPDRSRIEAGRPPYTSFAESLEQKYRRTLSQVDAYVHDFRTQSTKFPWKQAVATHFRADKCKLPNLDRSASMVKKPPIESAHLPHDAGLSLMPSRTRPRGKSRFENGPTIHAKKTKPATESAFLSKRSGSGGYEEFMKFLNNDVENFCSEIRDMCRSDYTAQQFVDAICNAQLNRRDDGEASDSASEYSADDPIGAVFHLHADVLQEICWSLANKLFLTDETHGVKLTPTQAMLITMRDFGIYPILLDTRQMFDIIMEAITGCVHGLPESETQRYQNILQAVILTAAVTVFRHDPLNLGVGHAIDADASESHLLHVMLIYMKLDERSRVDAFLAQFLTPQQAEDKLERLTAQKNLRNTIAQRFAGQSDPIMRTIRRWQRPLQDIFHFFSSHLKSASASDATAAAMSQRAIHESRNMPPTDTISKTNEEKLRRFNEKRLEVLRTLNISTSEDKKALPASPIDARRAALKRVSVLKAYGKIDAAEGAYLAECLAEPDELQLSATSTKVDLELSKKEQEHRKNKQRAYQYLISRTSDAKECLNSEDFIPLCNGDLATAEILFKCVKKKYADRVEEDEFVRSLWTDSLCETVLKTISEEEKSMMSPLQEVCGELPKAYRWAQEEYLKEDVADTARRFKTAYVEDIDHRIGRADTSKIAVWQAADDMLRELHAEVSEKIGAVRSRQTPKVEDDLDQLSSAFAQRMGYTDKDFIDVTDESYLSASQNYSVRRAVKTNQKAANEMMATAGAENLFGFKRTTSIQKSASVNDSEEISGHAAPGEITTFGALSFLVRMPTMKKRVMDKANAVTSWLDKDDDVPERCVSPNSVIDVGTMLKFAQVFGWIGSREQVEQGLALMDDLEFYEVCSRHSKMGCKFQLNWNSFLDMLIDVAVDFVKESHVHAHVHLDGTSSAYAEGLFMFMGLPTSTLSERDWLQKRMHEVLRFRLFDLVGLPAPKTLWLLPLANQPWRDGLHLLNDFRDVLISDMKGLLEGNVSKAACAEDWAQTVSGVGMTNTQYAGRVPSTGNVGHTPSRTGSAGFTAGRSPTRTLSTGSVFSTASNNPAHQQLSFFCIMICDSTTDAQFEKHCAIFQAVSWRHALRFFRMDTSNDEYKSGDFAEGLDWKKFPTMRLYCSNGLYREFEGCLDVSTIDHWFRSQGVHDAIRDEEHMDSSSKVSDALLQYLEVRDGVGEYLDAFLSLKQLTHNSGLRTVFPIKGFPSIFSVQVLELPNIDLSGSEVFPLAQCLKHNRKLIAINLENCRLQSDGLAAIFFALALNSKVKMLNLSSNAICVAVPSATPMGSSFTTLSTERVEEEDHKHLPVGKSVQALVDFVKCNTSLEKFELRSCGLNDVAIRAMSASLCVNLAMPLSVCDLSDNILGDDSVVALMNACETRNHMESTRCKPLQQLNLRGNRITKIGRIVISKYLKDAADNEAHHVNIILSAQNQEHNIESHTSIAASPEHSPQTERILARIKNLLEDDKILSLDEKFHMIRLCAAGQKFGWEQSWQLTVPFLESHLCLRVTQWCFQRLNTVNDKDAYSDKFDDFMKVRAKRLYHEPKPVVSLGVDVLESYEAKDQGQN